MPSKLLSRFVTQEPFRHDEEAFRYIEHNMQKQHGFSNKPFADQVTFIVSYNNYHMYEHTTNQQV